MIHHHTLWIFVSFIAIIVHGFPQQNDITEDRIRDIFNTNPTTNQNVANTPRPGFGTFVTPAPTVETGDFQSISGRAQCNCVEYHLCDPNTNTATTDDTFDGFGLIDLRFDDNNAPACEHFLDVCCGGNQTRTESIMPPPQETLPNRPKGCGIRNVGGIDFKLVGANDNEAGFGEFPWTVALLHSSNATYFCAGSLIHPQVVLTAVHCVIDKAPNSFLIRAGEWDSQTTRERLPFEERTIQRVITHPQFNSRNVANNFALLLLSSPLTLGDHINVVCLPAQNAVTSRGTSCISTGWGKDIFGAEGRFSAILKRIPLPVVEFNDCQAQLRRTRLTAKFALDRSFMCAGGQRGIDTCQGDGGAPLVCPIGIASQNRYHQSGIVSWGIGCNDEIPAAYANIAVARNWIDEQMLANGFDTSSYTAI